jgi:hypothetical protein
MRRKLKAIKALAPGERWLLLRAWILLLGADLSLRLRPRAGMAGLRLAGPPSAAHIGPNESWPAIRRLQYLVTAAADNHLYTMRCLPRSMALQRLLSGQGIETCLRIGVQRDGAGLHAHAWLEYEDQPIGQPMGIERHFVPLLAPESAP